MTIHGNTTPLSIYRGTLQGDTLSPLLFTIFMKPLLRWLFFSQYTGLQLETSKCEATGSLWRLGTPLNHKNQTILQEQINSITFADGIRIKYLPPNKLYKMIGVHISPMMDFREHFLHITKDVKKLAKALAKIKLSPHLNQWL